METNLNSSSGNAGSSGADVSLTQQAKQQTQQAVQKTQEVAGQVMDQAREQVKSQLETQKDRVAEGVQSVAQALRLGSEQLHEQHQDWLGRYADSAVEMVENISGSLKQKNVDQLIGDVESFGRRQPALFLLSAFALGFAATRFLKSSGSNGNGHYYPGVMTPNPHDRMRDYPDRRDTA